MTTRSRKVKKIPSPHSPPPGATILGVSVFLTSITWLVFGETLHHPSINFDDQGYVFQNPRVTPGLTLTGILWAFRHSHMENWHPLTWISHMLDCQLFGLNPGGHHFTNVLLHTVAVILLFLVFHKMKNHSEKDQFIVLFLILKNYNIIQNFEAVVADNSDTNDTLCQKIETYFLQVKNIV